MGNFHRNKEQIILGMLNGMGMRDLTRVFDVSIVTLFAWVRDVGDRCIEFHNAYVTDLQGIESIQCDETWSFVKCRWKNQPKAQRGNGIEGNIWTWIALDDKRKLLIAWHMGQRDLPSARVFMKNVASRIVIDEPLDIKTDGMACYRKSIEVSFPAGQARWVSMRSDQPGRVVSKRITNNVENLNGMIRGGLAQFQRYSRKASKSKQAHERRFAIWVVYYNFVRVHKSLGTTPAVAAGLAKEPWTMKDLLSVSA